MKDVKPRSKIVVEQKWGEEASTSSVRTVLTPTETQQNSSESRQVVQVHVLFRLSRSRLRHG